MVADDARGADPLNTVHHEMEQHPFIVTMFTNWSVQSAVIGE